MKKLIFCLLCWSFLPGFSACQKEKIQVDQQPLDLSPTPEPDGSCEMVCYHPEMPYLLECAGLETRSERRACSEQRMLEIIYSNLCYPAVDSCVEGMVVVSFIIREDGSKEQFRIMRGIHPLFDEEALRVVKLLPEFVLVEQFGKMVPFEYYIPVRFKLY